MVPRVLLTSLIAMAMLTYYFESTAADRESFYSNVIGVSAIVGFGSSSSSGGRFLDVGIDQSQQEEFDGNVYETRSEENRIPIKPGEFWVTDEDEAIPPFPVNFTPPNDSWGSFETLPHCSIDYADSRDGFPTKVVFVNVVRTEANWVQDFLTSYASTCHAGYASVAICSSLSWESMVKGTWANRKISGVQDSIRCRMREAKDRKGRVRDQKYVESKFLTKNMDVLVGQIPLGSHEQWKENKEDQGHAQVVNAQSIVSLRNPYIWIITSTMDGLLKKSENGVSPSVNKIAEAVKREVTGELENNSYHEIFARYLIKPAQINWILKEDTDFSIERRVSLSLRNLLDTNALIVLAEDVEGSQEKLQYMIDPNSDRAIVKLETPPTKSNSTIIAENVLKKIKKDQSSYDNLKEYLKYEMQIYEQAQELHKKQVAWVRKNKVSL